MKRCSDYEIELSALLDGESDPAMALTLVGHVAECSDCSSFVRELSSSQKIIDSLRIAPASVPDSAVTVSHNRQRSNVFGLRPQWAVGLAAALERAQQNAQGTLGLDVGEPVTQLVEGVGLEVEPVDDPPAGEQDRHERRNVARRAEALGEGVHRRDVLLAHRGADLAVELPVGKQERADEWVVVVEGLLADPLDHVGDPALDLIGLTFQPGHLLG